MTEQHFLIFDTRLVFIKFIQVFTLLIIIWDFNLEYYIQIEIDILEYLIRDILNQLIFYKITFHYIFTSSSILY